MILQDICDIRIYMHRVSHIQFIWVFAYLCAVAHACLCMLVSMFVYLLAGSCLCICLFVYGRTRLNVFEPDLLSVTYQHVHEYAASQYMLKALYKFDIVTLQEACSARLRDPVNE